jgi:hypothetical protein
MRTERTVARRIWRGWTTVENADAYQAIAAGDVFPAILDRGIPGLLGAQLMRADDVVSNKVEFTTIIWFDNLDSIRNLMGENCRRAHMPKSAQGVLKRYGPEAKRFHLVGEFASEFSLT